MKNRLILILVGLWLLCFSGTVYADEAQSKPLFTWPAAYSIGEDQDCNGRTISMIYTVDGSNSRTEVKVAPGMSSITIMRGDKQTVTAILNGTVSERSADYFGHKITLTPTTPFPTSGTWTSLGKENVNGKQAVKYKITSTLATEPGDSFYVWLSEDSKTPLRMESKRITLQFTSYKIGSQNPKLFEAPSK